MRNGKAGHATRKTANKAKRDDMSAFLEGLTHVDVFPDAKSAWEDFNRMAGGDKHSQREQENAKFIFMNGYQRAANLFIYCAGATQSIDIAADQVTKDCMDFETEAEAVLARRKAEAAVNDA